MVDLNAIQSIIGQLPGQNRITDGPGSVKNPIKGSDEPGFAEVISDFLSSVNEKQAAAVEKTNELVSGESQDLLGAMTSMEESRLSFQLLLEIRNNLLESYKEIQRMQI